MKKLFILFGIIALFTTISPAQNKKAEKEAAAKAQFDKAVAAIEAKEFVIIVDTYEGSDRTMQTSTEVTNFLSYEKGNIFMQDSIVAGNGYTNKVTVSDFQQAADKKGNLKIEMHVKGTFITAKIEIFLRKGSNYADVNISPSTGKSRRFSGEIIPRSESKYFKRPGEV